MSSPLVFVFPGQSSRDPEMFERLRKEAPESVARALADFEAFAGRAFDGEFATNLDVQLAVFLATRVYRELASKVGLESVDSAGLSLGEFSHLVHIGALDEESALALVAARGRTYDEGPDGAMYVVQPVAIGDLDALVARVREELAGGEELVSIASYNSPSQFVVAGRADAAARTAELAEETLYASCRLIESRIPMHSPRFEPASRLLRRALEEARFRTPIGRYWPNVLGAPLDSPSRECFVSCLVRHVFEPVQWRRTVDALVARHSEAVFVEVGPRSVLTGLLRGRWHRNVGSVSLDPASDVRGEGLCSRLEEIHDVR